MANVPPLPPPPGIPRTNANGTPTQAQIDYERKLSAWVQSYTSSLVTGIPFPSPTTLGGVLSATAPTHKFQRGIDTGGNPLFAQPSAGDISGLGSLATASTVAVGSITGLGALATQGSVDLATQATGNLGVSHFNSGIDASSSKFWRGDGTWASPSSVPGGSSGQVQFNNAGTFGGFTVGGDGSLDVTTGLLTITKTGGVALGSLATLNSINNANWSGTALSVSNGGTGTGTPGLVAGTNITVSGSWPNQTINSSNSGGSVTSVGLALPSIFSVTGTPVTVSGTLTGALATQSANTVFAGPSSGGAAAPTFRTISSADLSDGNVGTGAIAHAANPSFTGTAVFSTISASTAGITTATIITANVTTLNATTGTIATLTAPNVSGAYAKLTNTTGTGQLSLSGTGNDNGAYILGYGTNTLALTGGTLFDGTNWIAKATTINSIGLTGGVFGFYSDSGLTIGNTFTPTIRFGWDATGTLTTGTVPIARITGAAASGANSDITSLTGITGAIKSSVTPSAAWALDCTGCSTGSIAASGTYTLQAGAGLLVLDDISTTGQVAVFLVGTTIAPVLIAQTSTAFANTVTANKYSLTYNGSGSYIITNSTASAATFNIGGIRTRTTGG